MRALIRLSKRATEQIVYPIDANPWLQSVNSTFGSYTVGDVPDIVEAHSVANGVVTLTMTAGSEGEVYRIPVTFTATNGLSRATMVEVTVLGVAPAGSSSGSGGSAVANIDGGTPTSVYGGVTALDGGAP